MSAVAQLQQKQAWIRSELSKSGTNVALNDGDLLGDGDQSSLESQPEPQRQFHRTLWAEGGDFYEYAMAGAFSAFARACIGGNVKQVEAMLQKADTSPTIPSPELLALLETRETSMRLSPLLMMVSIAKNLQGAENDNPSLHQGQLNVAKILLKYGARPDAKDVVGKTVCHYGMGMMATPTTLQIGDYAIACHDSQFFFGKQVELHSLQNEAMNGLVGWDRGFVAETDRRRIVLPDRQETVAIKPVNLRLFAPQDSNTNHNATPLCDIQDRLGSVVLMEIVQSDREDSAKILLEKYNANVYISDWDGISAYMMSTVALAQGFKVAPMFRKHGAKQGRAEKRKCAWCKKEEAKFQCSACRVVGYCSKPCQQSHWKMGGHKQRCNELSSDGNAVVLERPSDGIGEVDGMHSVSLNWRTMKRHKAKGYQKPSTVAYGEKFCIKIQCGETPITPLMIYDKTRECEFYYNQGEPGFMEMFKKARAETATNGRKTYIKASFSQDGKLTVYPATATIKSW